MRLVLTLLISLLCIDMIIGLPGASVVSISKPAAGFSPSDIAGLVLWLKSDAGVLDASDNPITADSTQVKTWQDQSGKYNRCIQIQLHLSPGREI